LRSEGDFSRQLKQNESFQLLYSPFDNNVLIEKQEVGGLAQSTPVCNV
jgi:hypothetical protein